jgi:hypothetical protein
MGSAMKKGYLLASSLYEGVESTQPVAPTIRIQETHKTAGEFPDRCDITIETAHIINN